MYTYSDRELAVSQIDQALDGIAWQFDYHRLCDRLVQQWHVAVGGVITEQVRYYVAAREFDAASYDDLAHQLAEYAESGEAFDDFWSVAAECCFTLLSSRSLFTDCSEV